MTKWIVAAVVLLPAIALAQAPTVDRAASFEVDRLVPTPGPGTFFQVEDGDVAPHLATSFALVSSIITEPLVVYSVADSTMHKKGDVLSRPVRTRIGMDVMAAVGLGGRYQIGLAMPVVLYQDGDRLRGLDLPDEQDNQKLATTTQGDLRLFAKIRFVEPRYGTGLAAGADVIVGFPTGDDDHFAGEAGTVFEARLIGSYRTPRAAVALNLGPRIRETEVQFLDPSLVMGDEIAWGLAGSAVLPWKPGITAILEIAGAWGVEEGSGKQGPDPAEVRGGVRWQLDRLWSIGVAAGTGLGAQDAIGSPAFRGIAEVRYIPRTTTDSDRDGVADGDDRCPTEAEDRDDFQDSDGCPDLDDDGDGVADKEDACPKEKEDRDNWRDQDGCPDRDNDDDGVSDELDQCPDEAEDLDGVKDADGCPDGDNDRDGVDDAADKCKDQPEDKDGHDDADGCPDLDDDIDGVPDAQDKCPDKVEDRDGFLDEDGCPDDDDDRDGVLDGLDQCPDQPETITSLKDGAESDGCPDGVPLARPAPDGTFVLQPAAKAALKWTKAGPLPTAGGETVLLAIARAAHRAGWDEVKPALKVTVFDDAGKWSDLAMRRSEGAVEFFRQHGVPAEVDATGVPGKGPIFQATPDALKLGPTVPVKQPPR